jgi:hypothetical protein
VKRSSPSGVRSRPNSAAVRLNNRTGNRQSQTCTLRFCSKKRVKDHPAPCLSRGNPRSQQRKCRNYCGDWFHLRPRFGDPCPFCSFPHVGYSPVNGSKQAITQACAVCSPKFASVIVIRIFQQSSKSPRSPQQLTVEGEKGSEIIGRNCPPERSWFFLAIDHTAASCQCLPSKRRYDCTEEKDESDCGETHLCVPPTRRNQT